MKIKLVEVASRNSINGPDAAELAAALQRLDGVERSYCGKLPAAICAAAMKVRNILGIRPRAAIPRSAVHLAILMAGVGLRLSPQFLFASNRSVYLYDCFPEFHRPIRQYLVQAGVQSVFVSSRRFADDLERMDLDCRVHYIPEGVDPDQYVALPLEDKSIDVIEFGRTLEDYHARIRESLRRSGRTHQYQFIESREEFVRKLSQSRISICFPRTLTNPELDPEYEYLTMRYLQSMASNCLVVGKAPQDLIGLFGYNPVVEVDFDKPEAQLETILSNFDQYESLINKNRELIRKGHTWNHRARKILEILKAQSIPQSEFGRQK